AFASAPAAHVYRIARVVDGDTVYLTNGAKIRLVQIDTPEVYFGAECWGHQASAETSRLLPVGTAVRLGAGPGTGLGGRYGRRRTWSIAMGGCCGTCSASVTG